MNHYEVCTVCGVLHDKTLGVAINPKTKGMNHAELREMAHRGVCNGCGEFRVANERIKATPYDASAPLHESKLPVSKISS